MKKNTYSPEEIDELKEWFDTHQDTIPQDMYIEGRLPAAASALRLPCVQLRAAEMGPGLAGEL